MESHNRPYRSLFWPILLVGVGVIWLLANLGILQPDNLNLLASLWPLILIVIGLDLLFGRKSPVIGASIGLLAVAAVVFLLFAGPALGLKAPAGAEVKIDRLSEPLGSTTALTFRLDSSSPPVHISPASDSSKLFDATIGHTGQLDYSVSGGTEKTISLSQKSVSAIPVFNFGNTDQLRWDIGLSTSVPTRLEINSGSGSVDLDLGGLKLTGGILDSGSGSVTGTLPESAQPYAFEQKSGSGAVTLTLPANTNLDLQTDSGSGSLTINLPPGGPARVEVTDSGSGSITVKGGLNRVSGGSDDEKEGTWESAGYAQAASKILIRVVGAGSGSITIH